MSFLETVSANRGLTLLVLGPLLLVILLATFSRVKKVSPVAWGWFGQVNSTRGVAIQGFDPVAYQAGRAAAGNAEWSTHFQGSRWHFSSPENLELFKKAPDRYAPQFGGFCAFAVSKGLTADSNPEVFAVEGGKTYLFDSEGVKADWSAGLGSGILAESRDKWSRR